MRTRLACLWVLSPYILDFCAPQQRLSWMPLGTFWIVPWWRDFDPNDLMITMAFFSEPLRGDLLPSLFRWLRRVLSSTAAAAAASAVYIHQSRTFVDQGTGCAVPPIFLSLSDRSSIDLDQVDLLYIYIYILFHCTEILATTAQWWPYYNYIFYRSEETNLLIFRKDLAFIYISWTLESSLFFLKW